MFTARDRAQSNLSGASARRWASLGCALALLVATGIHPLPAAAGQLVYTPVNPSFGGSPFNGDWLLNNAASQSRANNGGAASDPAGTNVNLENLLGDIDTVIGIDVPGVDTNTGDN